MHHKETIPGSREPFPVSSMELIRFPSGDRWDGLFQEANRELMKQLRDNIQGYPPCPKRYSGFSSWQTDILDEVYQELCNRNYNLSWTECTDQYMTFTLHKKASLEFALRMKKKSET